jgi:pyridoxamine 5'-phosphate oxidase
MFVSGGSLSAHQESLFDTVPESPWVIFGAWMTEAAKLGLRNPNAMSLATIGSDGFPDSRYVLLKGYDPDGLVFFTNSESKKGQDLVQCPRAAAAFYWESLGKQIRISGTVENIPDSDVDAYFSTRPRVSQIGAWASKQSHPLKSFKTLQDQVQEIQTRFEGREIPRPPHWQGFRLVPATIEFWLEQEFRLHHRLQYRKNDSKWVWQFLSP